MATSPTYGWEEPDDTDLVKDGALSIRTMGNAIDSTLATALNSKTHAGLVLIKTQTIGTAVTSVTVSNAFSADYDNYKIIVSGGAGSVGSNNFLGIQLGSVTSGYYGALTYGPYASGGTASNANINNYAVLYYVGAINTYSLNAQIEVNAPYLTEQKLISGKFYDQTNFGSLVGLCDSLASQTSFTLTVNAGNITGGTIAVYGYAKA